MIAWPRGGGKRRRRLPAGGDLRPGSIDFRSGFAYNMTRDRWLDRDESGRTKAMIVEIVPTPDPPGQAGLSSAPPRSRRLPGLVRGDTPVGLPALAATAPTLQQRKAIRVHRLPSRSALNRCTSSRVPFDYTLNPYRGCEFGCVYCYARYTHEWLGLDDAEAFETELFAKQDTPEQLRRELSRARLTGARVALGTVTDPYQPVERRLALTRRLLLELNRAEGLQVSITTKSDLVTRDLDLFENLSRRHRFTVNMTVVTTDAGLARGLEPRAPRPDLRLAALARLRARGINAGVFAMPILPGITDGKAALESLCRAAAAAGATYLCAGPLFVRSSTRPTLFDFLARDFPHLLPRYRRAFAHDAYLPAEYSRRLAARLAPLRAQYGLPAGETSIPPNHRTPTDEDAQLDDAATLPGGRLALG